MNLLADYWASVVVMEITRKYDGIIILPDVDEDIPGWIGESYFKLNHGYLRLSKVELKNFYKKSNLTLLYHRNLSNITRFRDVRITSSEHGVIVEAEYSLMDAKIHFDKYFVSLILIF